MECLTLTGGNTREQALRERIARWVTAELAPLLALHRSTVWGPAAGCTQQYLVS